MMEEVTGTDKIKISPKLNERFKEVGPLNIDKLILGNKLQLSSREVIDPTSLKARLQASGGIQSAKKDPTKKIKCINCGKVVPEKNSRCSRCQKVYYCSKECQ